MMPFYRNSFARLFFVSRKENEKPEKVLNRVSIPLGWIHMMRTQKRIVIFRIPFNSELRKFLEFFGLRIWKKILESFVHL